jgi:hypothetical protein
MDRDKSASEGMQRKIDNGWQDKWTFALPVRRAWRIERKVEIRHLVPTTYTAKRGRAIAAWSDKLKAGITKDPKRRCEELNFGIPPAAPLRWSMWQLSAEYPDGASAKAAEDALKADFAVRFESPGGEFFLGDETALITRFTALPNVARFVIRA